MEVLTIPSTTDLVRAALAFLAWQHARNQQLPPPDTEADALYIINAVECGPLLRLSRIKTIWTYMAYPNPITSENLDASLAEWQRLMDDNSVTLSRLIRSLEAQQPIRSQGVRHD